MGNIYKSIEEYNPNKNRKILIVFDNMIADMLSNKKINPIVTELFIRERNLNIEEYNPNKNRKILIVFDNMIADMLSNKKINPIVTELFIRGRNLNISPVFITQPYFVVPKNI